MGKKRNQVGEGESQSQATSHLHNFGNDYCDRYLRANELPQSHIHNVADPLVGYPKLQKLHELKAEHTLAYASKPYGKRVSPDQLSSEMHKWVVKSVQFDIVLIGGCLDQPPTYQQLVNLPIQRLTPRPSVLFLWLPSHLLDVGRQVLEHWGFRRSEDIMYFNTATDALHYPTAQPADVLSKSTWHCLMGLKGTLRRSEDTDMINCNVDTDVFFDASSNRANVIPEKVYSIIENFALMKRRLHIVPGHTSFDKPVRARPGWVIVSPDVMLDNFTPQKFAAEHEGCIKVPVHPEIDSLRPKTPPKAKRK